MGRGWQRAIDGGLGRVRARQLDPLYPYDWAKTEDYSREREGKDVITEGSWGLEGRKFIGVVHGT